MIGAQSHNSTSKKSMERYSEIFFKMLYKMKFSLKIVLKKPWELFQYQSIKVRVRRPQTQRQESHPKVFYGGAIPGNRGGPRVKVKLLQQEFPQSFLDFNLVYALSNFPFLRKETIALLKDSRIPLVLNQNGAYWPGWYGTGWEKMNQPNSLIYRECDYVFWQSEFARVASRKFLSATDPPGEVLYNAVNLNFFHPRIGKEPRSFFTFLAAGNFNASNFYQIEGAFRAFARINTEGFYRIKVIGLSDSIRKQAERLSVQMRISENVTLSGEYSQKNGAQMMRQADAYLALKFMDTCPNLVIEALASGVPVVFSATGGTNELVDYQCGYGIPVDGDWYSQPRSPNPQLLAEAMRFVVDHRVEMSEAARARAEQFFDLKKWHQRHHVVFNQLLTGSN